MWFGQCFAVRDVMRPDNNGDSMRAAQLLAIPTQHCLVVEDRVPGIQSGHAAGMLVATLRGLAGDRRYMT